MPLCHSFCGFLWQNRVPCELTNQLNSEPIQRNVTRHIFLCLDSSENFENFDGAVKVPFRGFEPWMAGYEAQTLPLCFDAFLPALISVPVDGSELHYGGKSGSVNCWHISRVVKQYRLQILKSRVLILL